MSCWKSLFVTPRFGDLHRQLPPLPFSKTERALTRFDGGSEIDAMREDLSAVSDSSARQQEALATEDPDKWRRPKFCIRASDGTEVPDNAEEQPRPSVYSKPLHEFAVSQCPTFCRNGPSDECLRVVLYGDSV